jgi:quaternary ammonium compound-resistance protein SugE
MAWVWLIIAGVLEVVWALGLPLTRGFTKLGPSVLTLAAMGLSFWLLAIAVKTIPIGVAYPVWVGIGAAGAYLGSVLFFDGQFRWVHALCVGLILAGVAGLKLTAVPAKPPAGGVTIAR